MNESSILVIDDEDSALRSVSRTLQSHGFENVLICDDARQAGGIIEREPVSLVLLDLIMPEVRGEEILAAISRDHPDLPVVVVTAEQQVETAVRCMKLGAADYLLKPVRAEQLVTIVEHALEASALRFECARLREQFFVEKLQNPEAFTGIVSTHPRMLRLFAYLEAVSQASHPVLITGETGTGKELLARALHAASGRSGPFMAVNMAGLEDTMFSDTLFGHKPGAFTGATGARDGMIARAGIGTLFLDEIGDLSEASQVKLLRLLQEREYYPLGSDVPCQLRARVVAATHREPSTLRRDLYYRLRSYHVHVPPLRERLSDLPDLVDHFLASAATDLGKPTPTVPAELNVYLSNHDFPGNVRELQSMVFDAVARHGHGVMALEPFLAMIGKGADGASSDEDLPRKEVAFPFPLPTLKQIERSAVTEALRRVHGNQSAAARMLGVSRPTISRHTSRKR